MSDCIVLSGLTGRWVQKKQSIKFLILCLVNYIILPRGEVLDRWMEIISVRPSQRRWEPSPL